MSPDEFAEYSRNLLRSMNDMKSKAVTVGIQSDDGSKRAYGSDVTVLQVGLFHELGLGVPRRSFIESPFVSKREQMNNRIDTELNKLIEGRTTADRALGFIGIEGTNIVKGAFTSGGYGTWPQLNPITVAIKGSSQALIDTGILRNAISYKVVDNA